MKDIFFLVADAECAATIRGILDRHRFHLSLECGPFTIDTSQDILVHPRKDPGVWKEAHEFLALRKATYEHAIVILDEAWEGSPKAPKITEDITTKIKRVGWPEDQFEVIVIVPELENWIWQKNPHISEAFDFPGSAAALWTLLEQQAVILDSDKERHRFVPADVNLQRFPAWPSNLSKPPNPKGVVEAISDRCNSDAPSAVFNEITSKARVRRCKDVAFLKLRAALQRWFPRQGPAV